jgi:hypothetical protein
MNNQRRNILKASIGSALFSSTAANFAAAQTASWQNTAETIKLSKQWQSEGLKFAEALRKFHLAAETKGVDNVKEPAETRKRLAKPVLALLRNVNATGDAAQVAAFRELFAPSWDALFDLIKEQGQNIDPVLMIDDKRIVVRVGSPWESPTTYILDGMSAEAMKDVRLVGRAPGPNRADSIWAIARADSITLHKGFNGSLLVTFKYPGLRDGIPAKLKLSVDREDLFHLLGIIPFPDGSGVILNSHAGIYLLTKAGSKRLVPTDEHLQASYGKETEPNTIRIDMGHAALSPDGKFIAAGHQDSAHLLFDSAGKSLGNAEPQNEYSHYAAFSSDSKQVLYNACHFYAGTSFTKRIASIVTNNKTNDEVTLVSGARVYAAVAYKDGFIIGDANGYLHFHDHTGKRVWYHHIGSTINSIDISGDEKRLLVSTYAGFVVAFDLETGASDPYYLGAHSTNRETRRYVIWKREAKPLMW